MSWFNNMLKKKQVMYFIQKGFNVTISRVYCHTRPVNVFQIKISVPSHTGILPIRVWAVPYAYGQPIRVLAAHMHMGYPYAENKVGFVPIQNIMFFCTLCVSKVPQALSNYEIVDKLESKVVSVVKESIASQMSTNFESAKLGQFNDAYCKLQKSVEEISAKISNLSQQNSNLQMDIDTASESLSDSVKSRPVLPSVSPSITALSIADELADRERRKNNIIVYNFTETSDHQTDKDSFVNFCSSVFNCNVKISKVLRLGKKIANKHRPLLLGFEHYDDKVLILSHAHLLRHNDQYSDVFIVPDRTKFEREKHKKLVAELKERRTKGESGFDYPEWCNCG